MQTVDGLERAANEYFALVAARDAPGMERFWGPAPVWEMVALGATLGPAEARGFFATCSPPCRTSRRP